MKTLLLATTALVGFTVLAGARWDPPFRSGPHSVINPAYVPATEILYSQNSNFETAIPSDVFTSSSLYPPPSCAGADDFVIPAGQIWRITKVDATGGYLSSGTEPDRENVTFYSNGNGEPGYQLAGYTVACKDNQGNLACDIPGQSGKGLKLTGGTRGAHYWLSIQALTAPAFGNAVWGWVENTKIRHHQAMWEDPGVACRSVRPCITWGKNGTCTGYRGDYAFDLRGRKR